MIGCFRRSDQVSRSRRQLRRSSSLWCAAGRERDRYGLPDPDQEGELPQPLANLSQAMNVQVVGWLRPTLLTAPDC